MKRTIEQQYAQQTASELADKPFVSDATVDENHKGLYVRVTVPGASEMSRMYGIVDNYAVWISVERQ